MGHRAKPGAGTGLADVWETAMWQREQELAAMGTGGATMPQASAVVECNSGPLENSQHEQLPDNGEGDDD
eukprot:7012409-Karenia_brevis.AAC.1